MAAQSAVEGVGVTQFSDVYRGCRVLLTGHTGFKGSWLALWLKQLGAEVHGVALAPQTTPNHWDLLGSGVDSRILDLRDVESLRPAVHEARPHIVFHLAAQPLVRRSYRDPLETWSTNVLGTANLLDACRGLEGLRAIVVVTSDKCYENREWVWGYREIDPLGGHDPYSASKAAAELVTASCRSAFFSGPGSPYVATARAGNVIGGGDWSEDRLVPDLVRAIARGESVQIRSPHATRPWQHVLESLSGYLLLGSGLLQGRSDLAGAWNFGPDADGNRSVAAFLDAFAARWPALRWAHALADNPQEAGLLHLDSSKARAVLGWRPVWGFDGALDRTAEWYRRHAVNGEICSAAQVDAYVRDARTAGAAWCT